MTEKKNNKNEQNRIDQNQNQSVRDAGAAVPDYGKTSQEVREQSKQRTKEEGRFRSTSDNSMEEEDK